MKEGRPTVWTGPTEEEDMMLNLQPGQCGLCSHFGDNHDTSAPQPLQLLAKDEDLVAKVCDCDDPAHAPLHLRVTPVSGCAGFEPAKQLQA